MTWHFTKTTVHVLPPRSRQLTKNGAGGTPAKGEIRGGAPQGSIEAPVGGGSGWARPPLPPPGDPKLLIFYPWHSTILAMSYNGPGLPNPKGWTRHLRFCSSANAVTRQGLGVVSAANGAGNPGLAEVGKSFIEGFY